MGDSILYGVDETLKGIIEAAGPKFKASPGRILFAGFMAGAFIALGFLLALVSSFGLHPSFHDGNPLFSSLFKVVLGAVFPLGLVAVVIGGADLWTGNVQFAGCSRLGGRVGMREVLYNWFGSYGGNLMGALFVALLATRLTGLMRGHLMEVADGIAAAKASRGFTQLLFLGIACNWLVNLAIWLQSRIKDGAGRILAIWFPIFAFVAMGFEHSIANMWIFGVSAMNGGQVGWWGAFRNLIPVTIGNALGGFLFVSLYYWYLSNPEVGAALALKEVGKFLADVLAFLLVMVLPLAAMAYFLNANWWLFPLLASAFVILLVELFYVKVCPMEERI